MEKLLLSYFFISFSGSQQVNSRLLFTYWASHPDLLKVITYCWKLLHFTESHYILLKVITLYWKSLHFAESHSQGRFYTTILRKVITLCWKSLHFAESHYIMRKVITFCWKSLHFTESHYIFVKVIYDDLRTPETFLLAWTLRTINKDKTTPESCPRNQTCFRNTNCGPKLEIVSSSRVRNWMQM
jgi:hypothetical protein